MNEDVEQEAGVNHVVEDSKAIALESLGLEGHVDWEEYTVESSQNHNENVPPRFEHAGRAKDKLRTLSFRCDSVFFTLLRIRV